MQNNRGEGEMNPRNRVYPSPVKHKSTGLRSRFSNTEGPLRLTPFSQGDTAKEYTKMQSYIRNNIKKSGGVATDAYGEIDFKDRSSKTAKYVRVANTTNEEILFQLLTEHWKLKMPNLVISVTGGAKNFSMRPRLRDVFRKSLIKVAESTGAWITTGGTHAGVMKHVGKAVRNYAAISDDNDRVVTIGIVPWGVIHENESLINTEDYNMGPKYYDPDEEKQGKKVCLDFNHSHFILVDDGSEKYGIEIELRAKLERQIASKTRPDKVKVMIVCVIVQGGPGSLKTVFNSISEGTPVVIVGGSGGWADVLASASSFKPNEITEDRVKDWLAECNMEDAIGSKELPQWVKWVQACVGRKDLLSVFDLDPTDNTYDLDIAILKAILKANVLDKPVTEQLNLAMAWNRSDIARSQILTDDALIGKKDIAISFFTALRENKPNFCKLFLEYGVDLKKYCTVGELEKLYRSVSGDTVLHKKLSKYKKEGNFTLVDVGRVMKHFMGHSYVTVYKERKEGSEKYEAVTKTSSTESDGRQDGNGQKNVKSKTGVEATVDDPYRELFQWAILANYREIARSVWEFMWESMEAAIVATKMLKVLADKTNDFDKKNQMLEDAYEYEQLAVGILTKCFEDNVEKTKPLLVRRLRKWGGYTCLHIAIDAKDKYFVSRPAVQYLFDTLWMGEMEDNTSTLVILASALCLPLIWIVIRFKEKEDEGNGRAIEYNTYTGSDAGNEVSADVEQNRETSFNSDGTEIGFNNPNIGAASKKQKSPVEKLIVFYDAPVVTFWLNVVSFLVYLILFAYINLSNFVPNVVSVYEYILLAWFSTFLIEEIRELTGQEARYLKDKFILHISEVWNIMDIGSLILFYTGFGLRWNEDFIYTAQILYCLSFMIQCVRVVHIFAVHHVLGPKIIMVGKMVKDLLFFLFILVVFLLAYGVASQSLLYPNESNFGTVISGIVYKPYWLIYGELFLDEISYNPNVDAYTCSNNASDSLPRCPQQTTAVPLLSALYLLFANVLLLNLLIAMFSYTFDKVERRGTEIWKFQRYSLITDYYFRPPLVPPLIILSHIYLFLRFLKRKITKWERDDPFSHALWLSMKPDEVKMLSKWEHWHAEAFLQSKRKTDSMRPEEQLQRLNDRVDNLMSSLENLHDNMKSRKSEKKRIQHLSAMMEMKFGNLEQLISATHVDKLDGAPVKRVQVHVKARSSPYPDDVGKVRTVVPDDKVSWKVAWPEYKPEAYTAKVVLNQPPWADMHLESFSIEERPKFPFNKYDQRNKVNRASDIGVYEVIDTIPRNPKGRTGLAGRGLLGRYGPNHAADPVVTRWQRNDNNEVVKIGDKPVLQFVAIKRADTEEWAIPGGMIDPGENVSATLKREFSEEALNIDKLTTNSDEIRMIKANVHLLFQSGGLEVFRGYCDDHRNTDNAWIETVARNFHDEEGTAFTKIPLAPGEEVGAVKWKMVSKDLKLFASHTHILKKVAEMHNAYF